jgi:uncharacterized protein YjbI with pentapeptide repeats
MTESADEPIADRDEVLALLRQGPQVFNAWRVAHPDHAIDLARASLAGLMLDHVFLAGADLTAVDFSSARLMSATLSGADLSDANFTGADLTGTMFGPPDLVDSRIMYAPMGKRLNWGATLRGAVFTGANLHHTSFQETRLDGVDLRGCDLSTLDLRRASLEGALVDEGATGPADGTRHPPYMVVLGEGVNLPRVRSAKGHPELD